MSSPILVPVDGGPVALIDPADAELIAGRRWYVISRPGGKLYAVTSVTHGAIYMHRLVAGTPKGFDTDHINGNSLDNRRSNLRIATRSQNLANTWKRARPDGSPTSSRFKGVSWDKSRGKWQAKITVAQRTRNLGRYESEADAALAYDIAAAAEWGEFARLNFPTGVAL